MRATRLLSPRRCHRHRHHQSIRFLVAINQCALIYFDRVRGRHNGNGVAHTSSRTAVHLPRKSGRVMQGFWPLSPPPDSIPSWPSGPASLDTLVLLTDTAQIVPTHSRARQHPHSSPPRRRPAHQNTRPVHYPSCNVHVHLACFSAVVGCEQSGSLAEGRSQCPAVTDHDRQTRIRVRVRRRRPGRPPDRPTHRRCICSVSTCDHATVPLRDDTTRHGDRDEDGHRL